MTYGHLQRECHRLIHDVFSTKKDGYKWLWEHFKIRHLSEVEEKDIEILRKIYEELYIMSFNQSE